MEKFKSFLVWARITDTHDGLLSTTTMLMLNSLALVWGTFLLMAYEVAFKGSTIGTGALALVLATFGGSLVALMQKKSRGLKHAQLAQEDSLQEVKDQLSELKDRPLDEMKSALKEMVTEESNKLRIALGVSRTGGR